MHDIGWIVLLLVAAVACYAVRGVDAGTIKVDFSTRSTTETSHTGLATFSVKNDGDDEVADLFHMPSLSLPTGMADGIAEAEVVYTKTESTQRTINGGIEFVWKGSLSDSGQLGFATLIQNSDSLTGTFSTETSAFTLTKLHDGNLQLKETYWKDDLGTGSAELDVVVPEVNDVGDAVVQETFFATMVVESQKIEASITSIGNGIDVSGGQNRQLRDDHRSLQILTNVDVLVLVSNRAMCESAGLSYGCSLTDENRAPIEGMIKIVEEQTNSAMQSVGVSASVTFVRITHMSSDFDGRPSSDTLQLLRNSAAVAGWRAEVGADLVHIVTGDDPNNKIAGLSYLNNPESASSYNYFQYYSMSHEIFHCFGAQHNPEDAGGTQQGYGFGFRIPGKLRTIMSYPCPSTSCSSGTCTCPRIPYLSASGHTYDGVALGDSTHDNARLVNVKAPAVAAFKKATVTPPTNSITQCFSDRMTVLVQGAKGFTRMDELQVGDAVLTSEGFSTIISFGHYEPDKNSEFLQMFTTNQHHAPLEITADHLLYAHKDATGSISLVPASTIVVGDFLLTDKMDVVRVQKIRRIHRVGIYAPFTESGTIVVNGLAASNYIALPPSFRPHLSFEQQHELQHTVYAPYRMVCRVFADCTVRRANATAGFSNGVTMWFPLLHWLERQSHNFLTLFFGIAVPLSRCFLLMEWTLCKILLQGFGGVVAVVVFVVYSSRTRKGQGSPNRK